MILLCILFSLVVGQFYLHYSYGSNDKYESESMNNKTGEDRESLQEKISRKWEKKLQKKGSHDVFELCRPDSNNKKNTKENIQTTRFEDI